MTKQLVATTADFHQYRHEIAMTPMHIATGFGLTVALVLLAACAKDDLQHPEWPPQTEELVEAWNAHRDDIKNLRDMVAEVDFLAVALFRDNLDVTANDFSKMAIDNLENSDQWVTLMKRSNITGIAQVNGKFSFVVRPRKSANDRNEAINYRYGQSLLAKQCADQFRDISCGVCDILSDDEWSIRYTWWSGEFVEEHSENLAKVYQDAESSLSIDEVRSMYDESRKACMQSGLEEMGYENPEDL